MIARAAQLRRLAAEQAALRRVAEMVARALRRGLRLRGGGGVAHPRGRGGEPGALRRRRRDGRRRAAQHHVRLRPRARCRGAGRGPRRRGGAGVGRALGHRGGGAAACGRRGAGSPSSPSWRRPRSRTPRTRRSCGPPGGARSRPGRDTATVAARRARRRSAAARPDGAHLEALPGGGGARGGDHRPRARGAPAGRAGDGGTARRPIPTGSSRRRWPEADVARRRGLTGRDGRDTRRPRRGSPALRTAAGRGRGDRLLRGRGGVDERGQARVRDPRAGVRRRGTRTCSSSRSATTASAGPIPAAAPA